MTWADRAHTRHRAATAHRHGPHEAARYGQRSARVGEAAHPGPWRLHVRRADGTEAMLGCAVAASGAHYWQLGSAPRLGGTRRATPKEALLAWLSTHRGSLSAASVSELEAWSPRETDAGDGDEPGTEEERQAEEVGATLQEDSTDAAVQEDFGHAALQEDFGHAALQEDFGHAALQEDLGDAALQEDFGHAALQEDFGHAALQEDFGHAALQEGFGHAALQEDFGYAALQEDLGDAALQEDSATPASTSAPPLPPQAPAPAPQPGAPGLADGPIGVRAGAPPAGPGPPPARHGPPPRPLEDLSVPCWTCLDDVDLPNEFALDCPTLRFVPSAARSAAADATEALLRATLRAERGTLAETRAWKLLLLRERLLFWAPLRLGAEGRKGRGADRLDLARLVRERAGRLLRGDWEALLAESRASGRALAASRKETPRTSTDDSYLADAVLRKALAEECSRAATLLASPGLAPQTRQTATRLQELLQPRASAALAPAPRPCPAPPPFTKNAPLAATSLPSELGALRRWLQRPANGMADIAAAVQAQGHWPA